MHNAWLPSDPNGIMKSCNLRTTMPFVTALLEIFHCTHDPVILKSDLYFTFYSTLNVSSERTSKYTILQNKRMRRCGVPPPPPPIIFERLKLLQQIIYLRKENLSESPNHQKYWENILVSRFYEQFSRNRRNLGHFRKFEKFRTLRI